MARKYEYVKSPSAVEEAGNILGNDSYIYYIPRDYKEHTYPAFLELIEAEDAHEHDHYVWNNKLTKKEFIYQRRQEILNEFCATEREIDRLMQHLSDLQDEEDSLVNIFE